MTIADRNLTFANPTLSPAEFSKIAEILKERAGITLSSESQSLVVSRLSRNLKRLGFSDFDSYIKCVTAGDGAEEMTRMVDSLTTNTTHFFRENHHFDILKDAMPRLAAKARAGGRVRLWSAACSTGEEPYSIAVTLLQGFPDAAQYDVRVLATDISDRVLEKAEAGQYESRLADNLAPEIRQAMFDPSNGGDTLQIKKSLRDLVTFRYLNFVETWPVSGPFDIIFCRNVAIYMDDEMQSHLWTGMERVLDPEGYLFIGHSERIGGGLTSRLELFAPTSFRRPQVGGASN